MKTITRVIELEGIQKNYRIGESEFAVLKGIDLDIEAGEFIALMGPSGSGKSTLMNIVGCLDRPSGGRFILLGQDISQTSDEELARIRREELGFIFQTFNLIGRISVLKNVEVPMMLSCVARERRRSRALELLESANPTTGILLFENKIELDYIKIYDMLGVLVYESKFKPEIDISNLNQGIYLLKLYNKGNKIEKCTRVALCSMNNLYSKILKHFFFFYPANDDIHTN